MARFTVDELEKKIERPEPFEYVGSDETVFVFKGPKELHYSVFSNFGERRTIADSLRSILGEQYEQFAKLPEMDGYMMDALLAEYNKHYGIPTPGESDASST